MSCPEWKQGRCTGCLKDRCKYWNECQARPCTTGEGGPRLNETRIPYILIGAGLALTVVMWMVLA